MFAALGLVALVAVLAACVPPPPPPSVLEVYGDSLTSESSNEIEARLGSLLPGWQVVVHAFPGAAQCDFHGQMADDRNDPDVDAVVIAFSGNHFSPCIAGRPALQAYADDASWAVSLWRDVGVPVTFVATPTLVGRTPADNLIAQVYRAVGVARGATVAETDASFVDPATGAYERFMPCLVGECAGYIQVRRSDGVHFCATTYSGGVCTGYSSGAVRFADAFVQGVARMLNVPAPPTRPLVGVPSTTTSTSSPPTTTSTTSTSSPPTTTSTTSTSSPPTTTTTSSSPAP